MKVQHYSMHITKPDHVDAMVGQPIYAGDLTGFVAADDVIGFIYKCENLYRTTAFPKPGALPGPVIAEIVLFEPTEMVLGDHQTFIDEAFDNVDNVFMDTIENSSTGVKQWWKQYLRPVYDSRIKHEN